MKLGIENESDYQNIIKNKRIGLVTNFTGLTSNFEPTADVLNRFGKVVKLFTPEHGLHGVAAAGERVDSYYDNNLKMEIISLYGDHHAPNDKELRNIDVIVFDIQDIGIRYYTYIYTLLKVMEEAERVNLPVIVMDRPLPLGREKVLGDVLTADYFSFVGLLPLPNRYGMTIGELACWIKGTQLPNVSLYVSHLIGWNTDGNITMNGLPWVSPSPNLPTFDSLKLYPGMCLLEGTNVSEGRGTVRPFEQFGAPWINSNVLSKWLNETADQNGKIIFQPVWFQPLASKYNGSVCQGIQIHIMSAGVNALELGYEVLKSLIELYPDDFTYDLVSPSIGIKHRFIEYLAGKEIRSENDLDCLISESNINDKLFAKVVNDYYLY